MVVMPTLHIVDATHAPKMYGTQLPQIPLGVIPAEIVSIGFRLSCLIRKQMLVQRSAMSSSMDHVVLFVIHSSVLLLPRVPLVLNLSRLRLRTAATILAPKKFGTHLPPILMVLGVVEIVFRGYRVPEARARVKLVPRLH